jgi:putative membrane protein
MMWGWGQGSYGGWMGWFGPVIGLAVVGLAVAGIVALVRYYARQARKGGSDSALELLQKRYARGEISKEEFEEKRGNLAV